MMVQSRVNRRGRAMQLSGSLLLCALFLLFTQGTASAEPSIATQPSRESTEASFNAATENHQRQATVATAASAVGQPRGASGTFGNWARQVRLGGVDSVATASVTPWRFGGNVAETVPPQQNNRRASSMLFQGQQDWADDDAAPHARPSYNQQQQQQQQSFTANSFTRQQPQQRQQQQEQASTQFRSVRPSATTAQSFGYDATLPPVSSTTTMNTRRVTAAVGGSFQAAGTVGAAAGGGGGYASESKHVCLQDTNLKDCRHFGCTTTTGCQGDFITSEFTCCSEDYGSYGGYGGYGSYGSSSHSMFMPKNSIGSCDWSINYFSPVTAGSCPWIVIITDITVKVGTAFGTCYFGSGSELCGEPLCANMVMSVQGDVFRTVAYSHESNAGPTKDPDCSTLTDNWLNNVPANCVQLPGREARVAPDPAQAPAAEQQPLAPEVPRPAQPGLKKPKSTHPGVAPAPQFDTTASGAGDEFDETSQQGRHLLQAEVAYGYGGDTTHTVYKGTAIIISGSIDSVSTVNHHHGHDGGGGGGGNCEGGQFEWVAAWNGQQVTDLVNNPIKSGVPWIKPFQLKLDFSCGGGYYR